MNLVIKKNTLTYSMYVMWIPYIVSMPNSKENMKYAILVHIQNSESLVSEEL